MFKRLTTFRDKMSVLISFLDHIVVHEDYVEITLPENVVITGEKHLVLQTKGKLMLNPRVPRGRTLDQHAKIVTAAQEAIQKTLENK